MCKWKSSIQSQATTCLKEIMINQLKWMMLTNLGKNFQRNSTNQQLVSPKMNRMNS
jgi:hypothetical protein